MGILCFWDFLFFVGGQAREGWGSGGRVFFSLSPLFLLLPRACECCFACVYNKKAGARVTKCLLLCVFNRCLFSRASRATARSKKSRAEGESARVNECSVCLSPFSLSFWQPDPRLFVHTHTKKGTRAPANQQGGRGAAKGRGGVHPPHTHTARPPHRLWLAGGRSLNSLSCSLNPLSLSLSPVTTPCAPLLRALPLSTYLALSLSGQPRLSPLSAIPPPISLSPRLPPPPISFSFPLPSPPPPSLGSAPQQHAHTHT